MAGPSTHALPVLLYDPRRELTEPTENVLGSHVSSRYNKFEVIRVGSHDEILERVTRSDIPQYAGVIYHSETLGGKFGNIHRVHGRDAYMPIFVLGGREQLGCEALTQAMQAAGPNFWYVTGRYNPQGKPDKDAFTMALVEATRKAFRAPSAIVNGVVIKIGGSSFDYEDAMPQEKALGTYCQILRAFSFQKVRRAVERSGKMKAQPGKRYTYKILGTVGSGMHGELEKRMRKKYRTGGENGLATVLAAELGLEGDELVALEHLPKYLDVDAAHAPAIASSLMINLERLYTIFGKENAGLISPEKFFYLSNKSFSKSIPLAALAPHYIAVRDQIPLSDSDTHTLALAEYLGIEHVILLKRTDGIYAYDPNRGLVIDHDGRCADLQRWKDTQNGNRRIGTVSVGRLLEDVGISREGTGPNGNPDGSTGHLMEDSAGEYFRQARHVKEISIVPIDPGELFVRNGDTLEHIVTGETAAASTNWNLRRFELMRDALEGKASSKIVH